MDVKNAIASMALVLSLIACSQKPSSQPNSFTKSNRQSCEGQAVPGEYLVHWKNGQVSVERYSDDETFFKDFVGHHSEEIILAEPHYTITVEQKVDTVSGGINGYPNWGVDAIGAAKVWEKLKPGMEVKVAVIDSGVDINHPQLVDAIAVNEVEEINGKDDDGNGLIDDRYGYDFVVDSGDVVDYTGHGTHVAGSIAAQHDKGSVLGVAPNARIIPIAFLSGNGGGSVSTAINSIRYAVSQGAQVINASWGGDTCSTLLRKEVAALASHNILFVTAAGNSGNNLYEVPEYPAAFEIDNMITVGASAYDESCNIEGCQSYEVMAIFSNYGGLVHLMAPGAQITSTYPLEMDDEGIASINGTSMAAPHVAGAAALLWSLKPEASYSEIKQALLNGAKPGPFRVQTRASLYLPTALSHLE